MAEIRCSTQDEYVLNTGGILASLEKFSTLFGLKHGYILFVTAELVSKNIQIFKERCYSSIGFVIRELSYSIHRRQGTKEAFDHFMMML